MCKKTEVKMNVKPKLILLMLAVMILTSCSITINIPYKDQTENLTEAEEDPDKKYEKEEKEFINKYLHREIPDLEMKNLAGEMVNIKEIDKPFLLTFSRVDCPSCVELYPVLAQLKENTDICVVEVYYRNSKEEIMDMLVENGFDIDNSLLSRADDEEKERIMETFGLVAVPTTFFVDSSKTVQYIEVGSLPYEEIVNIINEYLF
jgi:thiol-disulfide isomerase/thioredoxin